MNEKKRLIIVDDHTIVRKGLRTLLSQNPHFDIIGEGADGLEAIRLVQQLNPDLVLIDISMPKMDGTMAIKEIKREAPKTRILVLTMYNTEDNILAALRGGADGYLLKEDSHTELLKAIDSVLDGKLYLSPGILGMVVKGYLETKKSFQPASGWESLSQREKEVLKLIAEGYKSREIANQLYISIKTVEKHRSHLREKLNLHNTSALTKYAIEKGLVEK
ncbi:MAG TPA: response regulator transcription factor [Thermodesulfobacteriota bacterium]|nr:response regulator transcription factor [Thermodesulfobacteriota bacterium]